MIIKLEGFPIYPDKIEKAQDWMRFLKHNQDAVNRTLVSEHMESEQIFSVTVQKTLYLVWYSQQSQIAQPVENSDNPVDVKHVKFWRECVDESQPPLKFKLQNSFFSK
ncbi:DUF6176 family protein [Lacticaseibacillus paracasei]|jgi:hypothetical protein|uniref:DUF6176 family protein n=1 Tax=Lacticaseibacillus paracasei TaxID=1597 RepID=UPI003DA56CAF